ncbi:DUF6602 domain-containing protein [Chromobacterium vaccinii]|uniref:DUF6602 domain-containing protein n=1 Tax=Chromobacterium vaccinii TaxID=1108595 RepID=UPI0034599CCA
MDAKQLFRAVSNRMCADFEAAAEFQHNGTRGTVRENTLRDFLKNGRLPAKFGLGAGEVVGHVGDVSRQCDIIIYDAISGLSLHYDEHNQIYPIDSVYGIVEVKSSLSKKELLDSLEKIKVFKEMAVDGAVVESMGSGYTVASPRSRPFGVVFAYALSGNSIDSLRENLREWESCHSPEVWPNYICVLNEGCIYHQHLLEKCIDSNAIKKECHTVAVKFKNDSLFNFYCTVHDMCSRIKLGPVLLERYFSPGIKIGRFSVFGRIVDAQFKRDGDAAVSMRLKESTLEKIVSWCANTEKISYSDFLKKQLGALPVGITESSPGMKMQLYLYNPDNFPGIGGLQTLPADYFSTLVNVIDATINGQLYVLALGSLNELDWESFE